jgi:hypothetical protein
LQSLGLDRDSMEDAIASLYKPLTLTADSQAVSSDSDATGGQAQLRTAIQSGEPMPEGGDS